MPPVLPRRTATRDRLVTTAGELFWSRGYAHTGVSAIMKRARATSGSFYHFFATKDDLLLAVLDRVAELVETEVLGEVERRSATFGGRIGGLVEAYRGHTVPGAARFGLPIGVLVHELGPELEEARLRVAAIYEHTVTRVAEWLAEDPSAGVVGGDVRRVSEAWIAGLEGAALMVTATGSTGPFDAVRDRVPGRPMESVTQVSPVEETAPDPPAAGDWKAW